MKEMSAREAHDAWKAGDVTIIDVREQDEYDTTRVEGVPLIPMSRLNDRIDEFPTDTPLVLMCRSGRRSGQVASQLLAQGEWDDVSNLTGGILAWAEEGLPYVGPPPT